MRDGFQIVQTEVTADISAAAVVVVPCLTHHLRRHHDGRNGCDGGSHHFFATQIFLNPVINGSNAQSAPNSKRIEGTSVSIVTLTRLSRCLVEVEHDGQPRHEEEEEHHPELLNALLSFESLPEETEQTEDERHAVEHIVPLVLSQIRRKFALVTQHGVVDERETGNPVAMFEFTVTLDVVLTSCEVPQEITPVHEVHLIRHEEFQVLSKCRNMDSPLLIVRIRNGFLIHISQPSLVQTGILGAVDAREEHALVAWIDILNLAIHGYVLVFLVSVLFLLSHVFRSPFIDFVHHLLLVNFWLGSVGRAIEQRTVAILLTTKVFCQREHILWRVLIHWRVSS